MTARTWRGAWFEATATELELECVGFCRTSGEMNVCTCAQDELRRRVKRSPPRIARHSDGHARAWRVVGLGGESSRVHQPKPSPIKTPGPRPTLAWFLEHGWRGSEVERQDGSLGASFTLHHPSGARLWLKPGAVQP